METFNSNNVEKLNNMLDTAIFHWMTTQEKSIMDDENGNKNYKTTTCPSTGIIGLGAELENMTPSEFISVKVKEMFHGEYEVKAYQPQETKSGSIVYPVKVVISDNKVINHNGRTFIYYKNKRELATVGSAIKICSVDKEKVEKALKYIDYLKEEVICCSYDYLAEKVADYVMAL